VTMAQLGAIYDTRARAGARSLGAPEARATLRAAGLLATITRLCLEARLGATSASAYAARAQRTARRILDGHGVAVTAKVVVANHVGYLDPLVISSLLPCLSIAKGETRGWPLIGPGLSGLGVLFVRRGDAHSGAVAMRRALRALGSGTAVLNFPEGTTSDGRRVGPFRRGIFGLARLAGVAVVPAFIEYGDDRVPWFGGQTFAPHYARLARVRRVEARVRFGDPIVSHGSDDAEGIARRARAVVSALVDR